MDTPIVGFLSDLSLKDDSVGMCKALMRKICRKLSIIDVTHEVAPFNVNEGAISLSNTPEYFPRGTIFACVVFPETGTKTRVIAVKNTQGHIYVAPNNGLLTYVVRNSGVRSAHEVDSPKVIQPAASFSHTFLGRDVIVSCVAHIANGFPLEMVGKRLQIKEIVLLELNEPYVSRTGELVGEILTVDKNFGNIWTNIPMRLVLNQGIRYEESLRVIIEDAIIEAPFKRTFGEVSPGQPLVYINSRGNLGIALNRDSFAGKFGDRLGTSVRIQRLKGEVYDRATLLR